MQEKTSPHAEEEIKVITLPLTDSSPSAPLPDNDLRGESAIKKSIQVGDVRLVATTLFDDFLITYGDGDSELLEGIFSDESLINDFEVYLEYLRTETNLTEQELNHISRIAATIVKFNGKQIGEGVATAEDLTALQQRRLGAYKNTDHIENYRTVSLADIQSEGIVMCVETSMIAQVLAQNLPGYTTLEIESTAHADTENAEGHVFNLLISEDRNRVIFVDFAYSIPVNVDGKVIGMPFVTLLSKEQLIRLGEGLNIELSSMGVIRSYRQGPRHFPEGAWKSSLGKE